MPSPFRDDKKDVGNWRLRLGPDLHDEFFSTMWMRIVSPLAALAILVFFPFHAFAAPIVSVQGQLLKPDGTPVTSSSVHFRLQVRAPDAGRCLLFQEEQTKDLSSTDGAFVLSLNDGTATTVNTEPFTLQRAFQNRDTFTVSSAKCSSGASSYTPQAGDGRVLAIQFNDGTFSGWEQLPDQAIGFSPLAVESMTVGGFGVENLLRITDSSGAPAIISPLTIAQHNALMELVNGTSAFAPTDGQALVWSAGNSRWQPGTVASGGGDWSTLANKPSSFPSDWSTLTGKPSTFAPSAHSHLVSDIASNVGSYFTYKPNNGACANGEVLKWETAGGGRWACGTDISATGGTGVASVAATAPLTVDVTDPNNPRVEIDAATTTTVGVVQLASDGGTTAGTVVQATDARLTNSRPPTGSAGGDLSSTYPNPTVAKIQGNTITLTSLTTGDLLKYNGSGWVNLPDKDTLGGMSCASGDAPVLNGSVWSCVSTSTTSTNNSIVRRDGFGQIQATMATLSGGLVLGTATGMVTVTVPTAFTNYSLKLPGVAPSSNGQVMASDSSGNLSWITPGSVTGVTVSSPLASTGGTAPAISMARASSTSDGYLSLSDWSTFNDKASLHSPTFTGTPTAPTALAGTSTTQIATTAFVLGQASSTTPLTDVTATAGSSTFFARADHVHPTDTSRAPAGGSTSITTLGTISSGRWTASTIDVNYGGTGSTNGSITGTGDLVFSAGGTNKGITLTPSGSGFIDLNGRVLVGASSLSPTAPLHVVGSSSGALGSSNTASLVLDDSSSPAILFGASGSGAGARISEVSGNLIFFNGARTTSSLTQRMVLLANGKLGIGVLDPRATLDVGGAIVGAPAISSTSTSIDFSGGNIAYTSQGCDSGTFTLYGLKDGGSYTLFIQGTTAGTCGFVTYPGSSASPGIAYTTKLPMDHGPTLAGKDTVYNFVVAGTKVYVFWQTGY